MNTTAPAVVVATNLLRQFFSDCQGFPAPGFEEAEND